MAHNHSSTITKSIDVGSMFLMDLSVHEATELNCGEINLANALNQQESVYSITSSLPKLQQSNFQKLNEIRSGMMETSSNNNYNITIKLTEQPMKSILYYDDEDSGNHDYLSNSLDRLACAINDEGDSLERTFANITTGLNNTVTTVEPQPPPEIVDIQSPSSTSSSLSDEDSFVASSEEDSSSANYSLVSEMEDTKGRERDSASTREDSGVLDMKDLDSQLNSFDSKQQQVEDICQHYDKQEKLISHNIVSTNLINKSSTNINSNHNHDIRSYYKQVDLTNQPTNSTHQQNYHHHHYHQHHHHHHHHQIQAKRSMSTSLPIQVPVRQMKKDLNKLKLGVANRNLATIEAETYEVDSSAEHNNVREVQQIHVNQSSSGIIDDVDEFLQQEYNDNHHKHYPVDEFDEDLVKAEDNPMKLFESIQALARSLHEDAELFGSLPPKRMLESPIRSLAFA